MKEEIKKSGSILYDTTLQLLTHRPASVSYLDLCKKINSDLSIRNITKIIITESWIKQFATGEMKNPSVVKVERLNSALMELSELVKYINNKISG